MRSWRFGFTATNRFLNPNFFVPFFNIILLPGLEDRVKSCNFLHCLVFGLLAFAKELKNWSLRFVFCFFHFINSKRQFFWFVIPNRFSIVADLLLRFTLFQKPTIEWAACETTFERFNGFWNNRLLYEIQSQKYFEMAFHYKLTSFMFHWKDNQLHCFGCLASSKHFFSLKWKHRISSQG